MSMVTCLRGYMTTMYWKGASLGVSHNIAGAKRNLFAVAKNCAAIVAATLSYQTDQSTIEDGQTTPGWFVFRTSLS